MSSKAKHSQNGSHLQALSPSSSTHMEVSPPSTPSRRSTSSVLPLYTSSPSNASSPMDPSPSRPQPFCEDDEQLARSQQNSTQFGVSAMCARPSSCVPTSTTPEVTNGRRASFEKVSLEEHMQHSDIGREEAMQSFILERFLPAAKVVATDHDHTPYPASKHHPMKPSIASDMSMLRLAKSAARLYSISPTFSPSKGVRWSSPLSRDEGEVESLYDDEPTKASGFFCVGLKTAISRVHKVVHPSAHSPLRSKSRAASSYGNVASCEEEDVLPKVNVLSQGTQRGKSFDMRGSYTFSSSSPTFETNHRGRHSSYMASSRNSLPRSGHVGQDGSPFVSRTSLDETSLHNMSSSCRPISPSIQQLRGSCFKQSSLQGNAWESSPRPPCDQACANCHWEQVEYSPGGGTRSEEYHLQNASRCAGKSVSVGIPTDRASSKGSSPRGHDASEEALRDPDSAEDDENEFYDALDSLSPIPDNATPLTCASPVSPKASRKCTSDKNGAVDVLNHTETPLVFKLSCKTSGGHANHDDSNYFLEKQETPCSPYGYGAPADSAYFTPVKQKHGKFHTDQGEDSFSRTMNSLFPLRPSSASPKSDPQYRSGTPNGHKKWLKPGWPLLGISGLQSGAEKSCFQEHEEQDDRFSTNSASVFTESNVSSPRVPPSPTASWLERAMALNASKPSTLATLQQKEKVAAARKKLEFTLSDTRRKDVKWEDVVKGSQMHPEHFSFSEEVGHRHPGNRKAIKHLRL